MAQKELVEYIAKALVDNPDAVEVMESSHRDDTLELHVDAEDRGKVIGRKGRTVHAIRVLLTATSPDGEAVGLDIVDA